MTMDTASDLTTTALAGGSTNIKNDDSPTCNMPDDSKDKDVSMTDMDGSTKTVDDDDKAPTAAFDKLTLTRTGTEISLSEGEDADAAGGAQAGGDSKDTSVHHAIKDTAPLLDEKKREKEFIPHKSVVSKKKAKVDADEETKEKDSLVDATKKHDGDKEEFASTDFAVAKKVERPNELVPVVEDKSLEDVLDLDKLYDLLERNKNAAAKVAGKKDVILPFGWTGSGKTTTLKFLAGTKYEFDPEGGDMSETFTPDGLEELERSDSDQSVTKSLHTVIVDSPPGDPKTLCDIPGYGDTKGTEMEISNGLMITRALKSALSLKPIVVVNAGEFVYSTRDSQFEKTLDRVVDQFGRMKDFSAFEYVFTKCFSKRDEVQFHKKLKKLFDSVKAKSEGDLDENAAKNESYKAILSDIIERTSVHFHVIDLEDEEGAQKLFDHILRNDLRISPSALVEGVSPDALRMLEFQVSRMEIRLENALKTLNIQSARVTLGQLLELASAISLPELESAVSSGKSKVAEYIEKMKSEASNLVDCCKKESHLDNYLGWTEQLNGKLLQLTQMQGICNISGEGSQKSYLDSAVSQVFAPIQGDLEAIKVADIFDKLQILQDSLVKCNHLSRSLASVFAKDEDRLHHQVSRIQNKVCYWMKVAASDLATEKPITSELIQKIHPSILFLLDLHLFLLESKIELQGTGEINAIVHEVLGKAETACNASIVTLAKLGASGSEIVDKEFSSQTQRIDRLESLCDDLAKPDVTTARKLLKAMVDAPSRFTSAIYKGSPPKPGFVDVVEKFDNSFSTLVEKVSILIDDSASQVLSGESAQLFEPQIEVESKVDVALEKIHAFVESEITTIDELTRTIDIMDEACLHAVDAWASFTFKSLKAQEAHGAASVLRNKLNSKRAAYAQLCNEIETFDSDDGSGLNDEQLEGFRQLGFDLSKFGAEREFTLEQLGRAFFYNFKALKEYMDAYGGNCYVDAKVNKDLAKWTDKQRSFYKDVMAGKENEMHDVHIEALNAIGFSFTIKTRNDILWDAKFNELVAFKEKNGHCNVTRKRVNGKQNETGLGSWVHNMRKAKKGSRSMKITPDRIRRLDEIGFVWDTRTHR